MKKLVLAIALLGGMGINYVSYGAEIKRSAEIKDEDILKSYEVLVEAQQANTNPESTAGLLEWYVGDGNLPKIDQAIKEKAAGNIPVLAYWIKVLFYGTGKDLDLLKKNVQSFKMNIDLRRKDSTTHRAQSKELETFVNEVEETASKSHSESEYKLLS